MSITARYSGTPLSKKSGIAAGMKLLLVNAPVEYFDWMETGISKQLCKKNEVRDFIHLFVKNLDEFETGMKQLKAITLKNDQIILGFRGIRRAQR
jgi:hypothetical protein